MIVGLFLAEQDPKDHIGLHVGGKAYPLNKCPFMQKGVAEGHALCTQKQMEPSYFTNFGGLHLATIPGPSSVDTCITRFRAIRTPMHGVCSKY